MPAWTSCNRSPAAAASLITHATDTGGRDLRGTHPSGTLAADRDRLPSVHRRRQLRRQATVDESVAAGVPLSITNTNTNPTGRSYLKSRCTGRSHHQGAIVELLVHYRGHWEPFRAPRTDPQRNLQGRLPIPGRHRTLPVPRRDTRRTSKLPIFRRVQQQSMSPPANANAETHDRAARAPQHGAAASP